MATGEEAPAIGTAFSNVEFFAWLEKLEYWQVIDMTVASVRKAESWTFSPQVAPLDSGEVAVDVVVRYLEPVLPTGEAAPTDYTRVEVTLLEEKFSSSLIDEGLLEEPTVLLWVEHTRTDAKPSAIELARIAEVRRRKHPKGVIICVCTKNDSFRAYPTRIALEVCLTFCRFVKNNSING